MRINRRVFRQAQLNTHYESYLKVQELQPWENPDAKFVSGAGDVLSPVVFVGEAPGQEEDRLGLPFVGKSGNLLVKVLKSVGLTRETVFITNLIKHRPPNNADPAPIPASAARVLMQWELSILKPRVVVTLGKFATEVFYPNPHMGTLSGTCRQKAVKEHKLYVVPLYHPSAGLRSSVVRSKMYEHIGKVREALNNQDEE